ncbi:Pyridoxal phosphate transferases superfamily protein [Perilla frutescens var. hirtella]|uniref:plant cystathionine gamma-synthase n=1 Tax=Perilla frutescens var. hirtella TaxID=608512 RepID=A0AAD4P811_PERFH|nr:Pyridoxal phosphate transferases superfamily protein [Perilla frutescens var. frutescens]KAH6791171.1 Pyridoxal phosphate transferases superfamily protein [Perilla frutescens var. frutescens]KAH6792005.1 Pyridoxal phosphate transferases superfamily protein [Perilla frutescens var. hirtella]KAH6830394.1 Pyridoxal phosphate transferases superfamily protein [Perilla frutescens var. hirtella]
MAVSSFARAFPSFECRSDPDFSLPEIPSAGYAGFSPRSKSAVLRAGAGAHGLSSLILKFPPNFVRQLSVKSRRNCSNIGVAQVVAASWSNNQGASAPAPAAKAVDAASAAASAAPVEVETGAGNGVLPAKDPCYNGENVQIEDSPKFKYASFLNSDGSVAIHAGERLGRAIVTDAITTPVVNTSAYFFKKTADLIDFKEKRRASFEYGRYGNYTTLVAEEKISALEGAESTLLMASGMCVSTVLLMALVPAGGHLVTTTDCYRKTRIFIENFLPKMGITATVIDPADIGGLESALEKNNVSLFFTESPTNPFLRCVDIERVSKLCHDKGALVCVDGTFATPLNQKALALGADLVVHSATKYIAGHNDVLAGSISGPENLVSVVRNLHHVLGGALNPNAAYLIIRGMKTLHLRVQQQNSTAQRMAEILEAHSKIRRVYYPGLASHPEHQLAKKQMTGFGGVVSFEVDGDLHKTAKFVDSLKIPYIAPSFGGCESIVDQPAIMSYWDLPESERAKYGILDNLVRFSFGVEDFEDLKFDILQALELI